MARFSSLRPLWALVAATALSVACDVDDRPTPSVGDAYELVLTDHHAVIGFPGYSATMQFGHPFGIVSLEMTAQPGDFAHCRAPDMRVKEAGNWV